MLLVRALDQDEHQSVRDCANHSFLSVGLLAGGAGRRIDAFGYGCTVLARKLSVMPTAFIVSSLF